MMMGMQLNTKRILIFLAFAFGISWAAILAFYLTIGRDDLLMGLTLANLVVVMTPALANVATRLVTREGWGHLMLRPNFRRGWRFYLAAWLLPPLAIIVGGALYFLLFPQSLDPNLSNVRQLLFATILPSLENPWVLLLSLALLYIFILVPTLGLQSIGEELGWRGYLLPKLVEHLSGASADGPTQAGGLDASGDRKAALLTGVIWGVWHWPGLFLMTKLDPTMHILQPLVYVVSTCSLSVLLSWVTLRSGSVWPAVVAHAANNWTLQLGPALLKGPANWLLGPMPSGLIGGLGYLALALVLLLNRRAFLGGEEAASRNDWSVIAAQS
jgi:membrane protease YdiL (CAAX protease family)